MNTDSPSDVSSPNSHEFMRIQNEWSYSMKLSKHMKIGAMVILTGVGTSLPSQAGDEGWAALGGFIGGLAVGNSSSCRTSVRVYQPQVHYRYSEPVRVYERERVRRPRYTTVTRSVWVPGGWVHQRDDCGRRYKVWQNGYYETVREQVRVSSSRHSHQSRHYDW